MKVNNICKEDLLWWKEKFVLASNYIKQYDFVLEIYSDASGTGWGYIAMLKMLIDFGQLVINNAI